MMKRKGIQLLLFALSLHPLQVRCEVSSLFVDLFRWHASQQTASTWASTIKSSGRVLDFDAANVNFDWKPGVRAGVLYTFEPYCWETGLSWTYFSTKKNTGFSIGDQIVLPEFFSGFLSNNFFFGANLNWKLNLNMVDLGLGKRICIAETFVIRPSVGIKAGTIHQTIHCNWNAGFYQSTEKVKNNFSGAGPMLGLDSEWNINKQFSLIANFGTALLYGQWKINDTYSRPLALSGLVTPTTITTTLNNSELGTLMYKCRLGLEWKYPGHIPLRIQLGYEMQFWPNQLRVPTFQQLPVHGDLTLQGGTCQFCIDL